MIVELEQWGKLTATLFGKLRQEAKIQGMNSSDQSWFWSKEWQMQEKKADADIKKSNFYQFDTAEDAIKHLHDQAEKEYEA